MSVYLIIEKALINEEKIVISEVKKGSTFKFLGNKEIDLYIFTTKKYVEKIIRKNILEIRTAIKEIEGKSVRHIYIDNNLVELKIEELGIKKNVDIIDIDSVLEEITSEISGENDIVGEMFQYESSFLNKKSITIVLYNSHLEKEFRREIETKIITSVFSLKKKKLIKDLKKLLVLKYEPNNNDTKEIINYLELK